MRPTPPNPSPHSTPGSNCPEEPHGAEMATKIRKSVSSRYSASVQSRRTTPRLNRPQPKRSQDQNQECRPEASRPGLQESPAPRPSSLVRELQRRRDDRAARRLPVKGQPASLQPCHLFLPEPASPVAPRPLRL